MAGVKVSYIGALVLFATVPLFLVVSFILEYVGDRDYRDFKKQYDIKEDKDDKGSQ
ncbi:hypothetical protein [Tamilnaduibacter salinus]|nr:hypothetical protein [Tamilnaduibacter salinus]